MEAVQWYHGSYKCEAQYGGTETYLNQTAVILNLMPGFTFKMLEINCDYDPKKYFYCARSVLTFTGKYEIQSEEKEKSLKFKLNTENVIRERDSFSALLNSGPADELKKPYDATLENNIATIHLLKGKDYKLIKFDEKTVNPDLLLPKCQWIAGKYSTKIDKHEPDDEYGNFSLELTLDNAFKLSWTWHKNGGLTDIYLLTGTYYCIGDQEGPARLRLTVKEAMAAETKDEAKYELKPKADVPKNLFCIIQENILQFYFDKYESKLPGFWPKDFLSFIHKENNLVPEYIGPYENTFAEWDDDSTNHFSLILKLLHNNNFMLKEYTGDTNKDSDYCSRNLRIYTGEYEITEKNAETTKFKLLTKRCEYGFKNTWAWGDLSWVEDTASIMNFDVIIDKSGAILPVLPKNCKKEKYKKPMIKMEPFPRNGEKQWFSMKYAAYEKFEEANNLEHSHKFEFNIHDMNCVILDVYDTKKVNNDISYDGISYNGTMKLISDTGSEIFYKYDVIIVATRKKAIGGTEIKEETKPSGISFNVRIRYSNVRILPVPKTPAENFTGVIPSKTDSE